MTKWDVAYKVQGTYEPVTHVEVEAEQPSNAIEEVRAMIAEGEIVSSIRRLD